MKIGILTYHKARNYGAQLQAVALRFALEVMGNEVFYVDYYPSYHSRDYALLDWELFKQKSWLKKIKYVCKKALSFPYWYARYRNFYRFEKKYIRPYCKPLSESYDVVICGSDQIWRKQSYIDAYNPMYFGDNGIKAKKQVSYAASISELPKENVDVQVFIKLLSNLDEISVREHTIKEFIESQTTLPVRVDVDPILLFTGDDWTRKMKIKRIIKNRYILVYDLNGLDTKPTFNNNEITKMADERGIEVVKLRGGASSMGSSYDRHVDGPAEFLSLLRYADFVFTSSYHGLLFSLLFEKQVYCSFPRDTLRAKAILKELHLSERYIEPMTKFPKEEEIDYSVVLPQIEKMRQRSIEYLKKISIDENSI